MRDHISRYICILLLTIVSVALLNSQARPDCDDLGREGTLSFTFVPQSQPDICVGSIICFDILVENFKDLSSFQFTTVLDPSIYTFDNADGNNSTLNKISFNNIGGAIAWVWSTPTGMGLSVSSETVVGEFCLTVVGNPLDCTGFVQTDGITNSDLEVIYDLDDGSTCEGDVEFAFDIDGVLMEELCVKCGDFQFSDINVCNSETSGSISVCVCGGTPDYDVCTVLNGDTLRLGGITENGGCFDFTGPPMCYTIVAKDSAGVEISTEVCIEAIPDLEVDTRVVQPRCGNTRGTIAIDDITGGVSPYFIQWSTLQSGVDSIRVLNGDHCVTVTDATGCEYEECFVLDTPPLEVELVVIDTPTCQMSMDGLIRVDISGGTPFFDGYVDTRQMDHTFSFSINEPFVSNYWLFGNFIVEIRDSLGCRVRIEDYDIPVLDTVEYSLELNNPTCNGDINGSATISLEQDGVYFVTIEDSDGTEVTSGGITMGDPFEIMPPLEGGVYTLTFFHNQSSCQFETEFTVRDPDPILSDPILSVPGCGQTNGRIEPNISGGVPNYEYSWSHTNSDASIQTDLPPGEYSLTVTDSGGCTAVFNYDLLDDDVFSVDIIQSEIYDCVNNSGRLEAVVMGNITNPSFQWRNPQDMVTGTNASTLDISAPGRYTCIVTDPVTNCTLEVFELVEGAGSFEVEITTVDPDCPRAETGSIMLEPSGGVEPYRFEWDDTINPSGNRTTLGDGVYTVTVTDDSNCQAVLEIELFGPDELDSEFSDITTTLCDDSADGSVTVTITNLPQGGVLNEYELSDGSRTSITQNPFIIDGLRGGLDSFIISYDNCFTEPIVIDIPSAPTIGIDFDLSTITDPLCFEERSGTASLTLLGGIDQNQSDYEVFRIPSPDITVKDTTANFGRFLNNLPDGTVYLCIRDSNGCTGIDSFTLVNPEELRVGLDSTNTFFLSCFDRATGRIDLNVLGGTGAPEDFIFSWSDGVERGSVAGELGPGDYSVIVEDLNGCADTIEVSIDSADEIVASLANIDPIVCNGDLTTIQIDEVSGGVDTNYTYSVNFGLNMPIDSGFVVPAGDYTVLVFDGMGCAANLSLELDQPDRLTLDIGSDLDLELGDSTAHIVAQSNMDYDSIFWSPSEVITCLNLECDSIVVNVQEPLVVEAMILNEDGCPAIDELVINIDIIRNVAFPNIFAPFIEGTSQDQAFHPIVTGLGVEELEFMAIYDRWGNQIWQTENIDASRLTPDQGWDGRADGANVMSGVYVYIAQIRFVDGITITYSGDVTLIN